MPRQDVPYPGGRCSLRCEIANLWNALKTKLHSINGVQGDGNGNVKILAGQNVQIVNDQVQGEITISATGGSAEDVVKSVNGELPDQDGDVVIDTGVLTVNGVSADADGEVTITAGSNITITPDADTNSIEISADVPSGNWNLYASTDWSQLFDTNGKSLYDMIIALYRGDSGGPYRDGFVYVPKDADFKYYTDFVLPLTTYTDSDGGTWFFNRIQGISYSNVLTRTSITLRFTATEYATSGSGADEVATLYNDNSRYKDYAFTKMTSITQTNTRMIAIYTKEVLNP